MDGVRFNHVQKSDDKSCKNIKVTAPAESNWFSHRVSVKKEKISYELKIIKPFTIESYTLLDNNGRRISSEAQIDDKSVIITSSIKKEKASKSFAIIVSAVVAGKQRIILEHRPKQTPFYQDKLIIIRNRK